MPTPILRNHKANFDYEILEKYEAGIKLEGGEVKSLRLGRGSLEGARVIVRGNEAFVIGFDIPIYQKNNTKDGYESDRARKLLFTKDEIKELNGKLSQKGLTCIPISVYNKHRYFKVTVAIVRAKKKYDKRETIKKRESDRHIERTLKRF